MFMKKKPNTRSFLDTHRHLLSYIVWNIFSFYMPYFDLHKFLELCPNSRPCLVAWASPSQNCPRHHSCSDNIHKRYETRYKNKQLP